jgi:hypothetical protein
MAYQPKSYRKFVATAATATLVASAVTPALAAPTQSADVFTDVSANYKQAVEYVVSNNIAVGVNDTQFGVAQNLKRSDAAIIIAKALEIMNEDAAPSGFTDVPERAAIAVNSLKAAGIINGKTATKFGAGDTLTRGEMALILAKAYALKGGNTADLPFTDVSDRYETAVAALVEAGITSGKTATKFGTADPIKRGEFAIFIWRAEGTPGPGPIPIPGDLEISSVSALNATNSVLEIQFSEPVSELSVSDIQVKNAKSGARHGVEKVTLSSDGKTAQVQLIEGAENENVLQYITDYTITVNAEGETLTYTFNRPFFLEQRVVDIDAADRDITLLTDNGTERTFEVPASVSFDFEAALGENIRVWYNDENEVTKFEFLKTTTQYDAIEITKVDEIKLLTEDKKYDVSTEVFKNNVDEETFAFYVNGTKVNTPDGEIPALYLDQKYNFAKVGLDESGDIEFVSAYNLSNFLVVENVEGDEVVGYEGEGTGGSFDAEDATIVKDGKVITLSDLKKGDVLFFNNDADGTDGYAEVFNESVDGEIDTVFEEAVRVNGKTYDFIHNAEIAADFDVEYGRAVYINNDGDTEFVDSDAAEELQAAGAVKLHVDRAGNVVYIAGDLAEVSTNVKTAILTDAIQGDTAFGKDSIQVEAVLADGKEELYSVGLENLNTITIDGEDYDIDDTPANVDEWAPTLGGAGIVLTNSAGTTVEVDFTAEAAVGQVVKLHLDNDGNLEEIEFFTEDLNDEGTDTLGAGEVLEAGDTYFNAVSGAKKLNSNTVVFDATDGTDADDVTVSTWGAYKGTDIDDATVVYDDDNEAIAIVINTTTTSDTTFEEAVITNVLRNTDREIVEISAYVGGTEKTIKVDDVTTTLAKGDTAVLEFDNNNAELVTDILVTGVEYTDRVTTGLTVREVNVGTREVTFTNNQTFKLVSGGAVLDGVDNNDITVEALTDLRGKSNVTVVLDERTGNFAKFFVIDSDITVPGAATLTIAETSVNGTEDNALAVTGTAEAGSTVAITFNDTNAVTPAVVANVTATPAGTYNTTVDVSALADGVITATATATDAAGNVGATSAPDTFTLDKTAPAAADATKLTATTGEIVGAAGAVEANSTVKVFAANADITTATAVDTKTADANGAFATTTIATDGSYDVYVYDAAGNVSAKTTVIVAGN